MEVTAEMVKLRRSARKPLPEGYDPELPSLARLREDIYRRALRAERRRRRVRRRHAVRQTLALRRVTRRVATASGLILLIGATAYGTQAVIVTRSSRPVHQTPVVLLATGHLGGEVWTLRAWRRNVQLCREMLVSQEDASRCEPPPGRTRIVYSVVQSPFHRYVFGMTGSGLTAVAVRGGAIRKVVTTHAVRTRAAAASLPVGVRWFVVSLPRPLAGPAPRVRVRGMR